MDSNEFVAATQAAKLHAEDHAGTHIATDANWALPVMHLLNMHMREENLPPIAFKTTAAELCRLGAHNNAASVRIWVDNEDDE